MIINMQEPKKIKYYHCHDLIQYRDCATSRSQKVSQSWNLTISKSVAIAKHSRGMIDAIPKWVSRRTDPAISKWIARINDAAIPKWVARLVDPAIPNYFVRITHPVIPRLHPIPRELSPVYIRRDLRQYIVVTAGRI